MTVFFAWELGGNLGHIARWAPLQHELLLRGITTFSALRELGGIKQFALQDPVVVSPHLPATSKVPESFTDILNDAGWGHDETLFNLVEQWRTLFVQAKAKVVLIDYAPTATLAARTLGIPTINMGEPFYTPPSQFPLPSLRPWEPISEEILKAKDQTLLNTINTLLARYSKPAINSVPCAQQADDHRLVGIPEIDCFERPHTQQYWGLFPPPAAQEPVWPAGDGQKVFAYLQPSHPHLGTILNALASSKVRALVFIPAEIKGCSLPSHVKLCSEPQDLKLVAKTADCAITSAATTTMHFLLQGVPVLTIPTQLEQFLYALRVAEGIKAGLIIRPDYALDMQTVQQGINRLLTEPQFSNSAKRLSLKYPSPYQAPQLILSEILKINSL